MGVGEVKTVKVRVARYLLWDVCSMEDKDSVPIKPQQYSSLNKTWTMTIWTGGISQASSLKSTKLVTAVREFCLPYKWTPLIGFPQ